MENDDLEIPQDGGTTAVLDGEEMPPELESGLEEVPVAIDRPKRGKKAKKGEESGTGGGLGLSGRPRDDGSLPGFTAAQVPTNVPRPRYTTYRSDSVNMHQRPKAAFTWAGGLPPWAKDKILGYVYRDWPYLTAIPDPPPGTKRTEFAYIDKVAGNEFFQGEQEFLDRYGCGRYRVIITEENNRPGEGKTLATVYVSGLSNDMKSFPPADKRISDISQVELNHPDNRSYIEFLRMRGLMPEQRSVKEEEQEMAVATTVSEMTGLVRDLVNERNKPQEDSATARAVEVVADAAKTGFKITQDANTYAAKQRELADEERRKNQPATVAATSTIDQFEQIVRVITMLKEPKNNDDILTKFMEQVQKQNEQAQKQTERMEALFKEIIAKPQTTPTPIQERVKDLAELKQMSESLWPREKDDDSGDAIVDAASEMGPKWLRPYMPLLIPVLTGLAQGWMAPRPSPGPVAAYPPQPQYQPQYPPPQHQPQFPGQPQFTAPAPAPGPVAVPQPQPAAMAGVPGVPADMPPQVLKLMQMIELPFMNFITSIKLTGTDFADWFVDGTNMNTYDQVAAFGTDALFGAIASYPPIAQELVRLQMPEKRVRDFVTEFCNPKWGEETAQTPAPPAPQVPVA
jgi:hypothetical protein